MTSRYFGLASGTPVLSAARSAFDPAQGAGAPASADESVFRANAPKFHMNFSAGNFAANGPLVAEDIDIDSNNVKLSGRANFVKRIERYAIPFPGMQLRDRIIIVEGNVAAVNYVLQGEHKGLLGSFVATGNKIEAMSGEVFEFNSRGLMQKLITITELDRVEAQIKGSVAIDKFQTVATLPNGSATPERRAALRATAGMFHRNFNDGHIERNALLATADVYIKVASTGLAGGLALVRQLEWFVRLKSAFPDMHIHDEYILVDGARVAVEYVMEGTQTGPYTAPDGSVLRPAGKKVRVRGIDFLAFDEAGFLQELVVVRNEADFAAQLRSAPLS